MKTTRRTARLTATAALALGLAVAGAAPAVAGSTAADGTTSSSTACPGCLFPVQRMIDETLGGAAQR